MKRKLLSEHGATTAHVLAVILIVIAVLTISFFSTAGVLWAINWALDLNFWSWKVSFGIWLALALISGSLKARVEVNR